MKTNIITVGTGDYWHNQLLPTLAKLEREGLVHHQASVDITPRTEKETEKENLPSVEHRIRKPGQPLSKILQDLSTEEPVVILGHANEMHTPDAQDLLENGFKVLVEKPYAVNPAQFASLTKLVSTFPGKIALAEYYLMMKAVPLLIAAGFVQPDSFYLQQEGILKSHEGLSRRGWTPQDLLGKLRELIGQPKLFYADVLEGEGSTGRVNHRGISLVDLRKGGGMIHDLASHTFSPVVALEGYLGALNLSQLGRNLQTARCQEYVDWAKEKFSLELEHIGETYAALEGVTSEGVPFVAAMGKYLLNQRNQRRIVIVGDEGQALLDMSRCLLSVSSGDGSFESMLEAPKLPDSKYYPVIRSCLEVLSGNTPYTFDATAVCMETQEIVLQLVDRASPSLYGEGTAIHKI